MGKNRIFFARWTPAIYWSLVSKPVSQDIQSICYCLHTGTFRLDTRDLLVAGVPISISSKYLYLYLALKVLTAHSSGIGRLQPINGRNLVLASQKAQKDLQYGRTDFTNLPDCEMKGI